MILDFKLMIDTNNPIIIILCFINHIKIKDKCICFINFISFIIYFFINLLNKMLTKFFWLTLYPKGNDLKSLLKNEIVLSHILNFNYLINLKLRK